MMTSTPQTATSRSWRSRLIRVVIIAAIAWFAWGAVQRLYARIDWSTVGAAFSDVPGWTFGALLLALVVRQLLNAVPLVFYVPGLGLFRSMINDTTANLAATFTPPPGDLVLRITMFRSWRLDPVAGVAGGSLNTLKFYAIRFLSPVLGLLLIGVDQAERRHFAIAAGCGLVAAALLTGLILLLRSDTMAAWVGRTAGRIASLVRKTIDPGAWADRMTELRAQSAESLRRGLLPAMVALVGMVLADATILLIATRAVGISSSDLPPLAVYGTLLLLYPLTLLPLFGFGILDALLVGALIGVAGTAHEPDLVAADVIWRVTTILGTLALGLLTLAWWRLTTRGLSSSTPPEPEINPTDDPGPAGPPSRS